MSHIIRIANTSESKLVLLRKKMPCTLDFQKATYTQQVDDLKPTVTNRVSHLRSWMSTHAEPSAPPPNSKVAEARQGNIEY